MEIKSKGPFAILLQRQANPDGRSGKDQHVKDFGFFQKACEYCISNWNWPCLGDFHDDSTYPSDLRLWKRFEWAVSWILGERKTREALSLSFTQRMFPKLDRQSDPSALLSFRRYLLEKFYTASRTRSEGQLSYFALIYQLNNWIKKKWYCKGSFLSFKGWLFVNSFDGTAL